MNSPDPGRIRSDSSHIIGVVGELKICGPLVVFVLNTNIVKELAFVECDDVVDFLRLLELFADFKVFHTVLRLEIIVIFSNELLQNSHTLFAFALGNQQVCVKGLALFFMTEDEFTHLCDQLGV